jgi:hypothetical protein
MNRLRLAVSFFALALLIACGNSQARRANSSEDEFKWEEYRGCKYFYKSEGERLTAMFVSCTLPWNHESVVGAMHDLLGHAYGETVFSEAYSKNSKVCMTGREHVYCGSAGGSLANGINSLVIDRTSVSQLMKDNNL